jgi:hypothetical protein
MSVDVAGASGKTGGKRSDQLAPTICYLEKFFYSTYARKSASAGFGYDDINHRALRCLDSGNHWGKVSWKDLDKA